MIRFFLGLTLAIFAPAGLCYAQSSYVSVSNSQFFAGGGPYYFMGANYWYGGYLGLEKDAKRGVERLRKELDFLKSSGVTNLRVLAGVEGSGMINGVVRVAPSLQPERGKFKEDMLKGLDLLLHEMGKRDMKAVVYFSNNWEWSGGFQQYLIWNGQVPDSLKTRKLNWDEQRDMVSRFYSCRPCKEDYLRQVNLILSRKNSFSGKKYTEDPAIMAWQLANEPRPMRPAADSAYLQWVKEAAAFIKEKDKNHLVSVGSEGEMGTESMKLFEQVHSDPNIDYLTIHIWPKNWSWFSGTDVQRGLPAVLARTETYIKSHIPIAEKLKKPLVIEEFGLPRDRHAFDIKSTTNARDAYFKAILSIWANNIRSGGPVAGFNFWSFGGAGRPVPGQVFWKEGDDRTGDPPMEEQGLNSVFDSDTSTWNLISSYKQLIK